MDHTLLSGPKALGAFLRSQRENTSPEMLGLPVMARRRTRGLRREEVAQLSGISTTWYTWIEQGREIVVSAQTLSNIAVALKMKPAERNYLFRLALQSDPLEETIPQVDDAVLAAVHQVNEPCYLLDLTCNMLAWNRPAARLFCGWLDQDAHPNMLQFMFLHPLAQQLVVDWEARASRLVAELRADAMHYAHDETLNAFVQQMTRESPSFHAFWQRQQVIVREGGERVFRHAQQGELHYRQVSWQLTSNRSLKMVMLLPEGKTPA
ncbi:helix-turn-helix transcriptional regulator [[Erwinia] mediterraneensis]|uniref:helix-turn-helix transcriptional regulator n=1 Tax=[Erwinia] mediterraneensis TaxID=2161819 RepID=UPI001030296E|nr:helix-turn-helix transcriptional regulator [[Erwinia] mediterraneensis]